MSLASMQCSHHMSAPAPMRQLLTHNVSSADMQTFSGHKMPVYGVRWNALHPRTFLSGSADWTVKLWDSLQEKVGGVEVD